LAAAATNPATSEPEQPASTSSTTTAGTHWMDRGMMLSSFSDGILPNPKARRLLGWGVVRSWLMQIQRRVEGRIADSVKFSPCAGPTDVPALNQLELVDEAVRLAEEQLLQLVGITNKDIDGAEDSTSATTTTTQQLRQLLKELFEENGGKGIDDDDDDSTDNEMLFEVRFAYAPTALYALRSDSNNTPGRQRQRARADGKQRRDLVARLLREELSSLLQLPLPLRRRMTLSIATIDFDDGSVKQTERTGLISADADTTVVASSSSKNSKNGRANNSDNHCNFPRTAMEAVTTWKPHILYVQGGNTFWLHHCIEKGGYGEPLRRLLLSDGNNCDNNNNNDEDDGGGGDHRHRCCFYVGSSAGAIAAGQSVATACWKGWDDPRVVPGMESYEDWSDVPGLGLVGPYSFFPHMDDAWAELVREKRGRMKQRTGTTTSSATQPADAAGSAASSSNGGYNDEPREQQESDDDGPPIICLRDGEVCWIDGRARTATIV